MFSLLILLQMFAVFAGNEKKDYWLNISWSMALYTKLLIKVNPH